MTPTYDFSKVLSNFFVMSWTVWVSEVSFCSIDCPLSDMVCFSDILFNPCLPGTINRDRSGVDFFEEDEEGGRRGEEMHSFRKCW